MTRNNTDKKIASPVPRAGPMFTRRLLLGYTGIAMLAVGIPLGIGGIISATTRLGLDAYVDGIGIGTGAALLILGITAFSLRGGRRPLILVPIGYAVVFAYLAELAAFVVLWTMPHLIIDSDMRVLAVVAAILLAFLSPFAVFVWRMVRDPALH